MGFIKQHPQEWLKVTDCGLYCIPGDFYIDPLKPVAHAVITHGHADHARPNHQAVCATDATLAIMKHRYREAAGVTQITATYGEVIAVKDMQLTFIPAGHILGSSQLLLEYGGYRVVFSGDYKRRHDPTCEPFQVKQCDIFITEATFGLPVFRHPPDGTQIAKLLHARTLFPERGILVGAYALGKCQRIICLLREAGYHDTLYLHGAMTGLCEIYRQHGVELGPLAPVSDMDKESLKGKIILAPPSALHDRWSRRLPDPITAMASGWMTVRARARQKGVELPLILSDHADWDELTRTILDVAAGEIWVTHGREDALVHYAKMHQLKARPLDLQGYEDEEDD